MRAFVIKDSTGRLVNNVWYNLAMEAEFSINSIYTSYCKGELRIIPVSIVDEEPDLKPVLPEKIGDKGLWEYSKGKTREEAVIESVNQLIDFIAYQQKQIEGLYERKS